MTIKHNDVEHSGAEFGQPNAKLFSKSWRIQKGVAAPRAVKAMAANTLYTGEDSIYLSQLTPGMKVYGGYVAGSWTNYTQLVNMYPNSLNVSIAPWAGPKAMCLDVEPGDAVPTDAPVFFNNFYVSGGVVNKPVIYTSAGDVQAVIDAMTSAGVPRNAYYIWSAHWIGYHICGPATCGFPAADATQYASNSNYDSDVWTASMFNAPAPPSITPVLNQGDTGTAVTKMQNRLVAWAVIPASSVDGNFGPATEAAVRAFQDMTGLSVDGVVGPTTWAQLLADPATFTYGAPVINSFTAGIHSFSASVTAPLHFGNPVPYYTAFVYKGAATNTNLVYARTEPATTNSYSFQEGGLDPSTTYTLHLVASSPSNTNVRPFAYATQTFTTGA